MSTVVACLQAAREAEHAGRWEEALAQLERALSAAPKEGGAREVADILRRIGILHTQRGDQDAADDVYQASLVVAELNGLHEQVASALVGLAILEQFRGRILIAEELYLRAQAIAEEVGNERLAATIAQNLGTIANICGDVEGALARYRSSLRRYRQLGDELAMSRALNCIGMAHVDLMEWREAEECFDEAFWLAERMQDTDSLGSVEASRAELFLRSGNFELARECCDRAFEIFGRLKSDSGLAEVYKCYGILFRMTRKPVLAETHLSLATDLARQCGDLLLEAEVLAEWALVHLAAEKNREALHCLSQAHRLFNELRARRELLDLDRRLDGLEATYLRVVRAWGESIESKDRYTAGHCERVANYACLLAEAVGITGRDLTWLRMGGYLHDVGKIAVPPEVLNKPGKLTEEEWRAMQRHTVAGDAIVAELNFPWDIRPIVRSHHERWNGSGYPDGLKGEEIPLTARILCVADVYDALTTTRSYRPALSQEEALKIMERDVGTMFDPELFPIFRALISQVIPASDRRFPAFGAQVAA